MSGAWTSGEGNGRGCAQFRPEDFVVEVGGGVRIVGFACGDGGWGYWGFCGGAGVGWFVSGAVSGGVGHAFAGVCVFGRFRGFGRFFGRGSVFGRIRSGGGLRGGVRYGNGQGCLFSGDGCLRRGLKGGRCRFAVPAFRGASGCPESSIGSLSPGMRGSSVSAGIAGCQAVAFPRACGDQPYQHGSC